MIIPPEKWPRDENGEKTASPHTAQRANEFRHYLLADDSVQWFVKLAKVEIDPTTTLPAGEFPRHISEDIIDVPSYVERSEFLANIYAREAQFGNGKRCFSGSTMWGWWSLSVAEYNRIKRMIELTSAVAEFEKLARYE